jgi:hypothetical protein
MLVNVAFEIIFDKHYSLINNQVRQFVRNWSKYFLLSTRHLCSNDKIQENKTKQKKKKQKRKKKSKNTKINSYHNHNQY